MAQYDGMVLTNDGIMLLTKSQIGQKMEFTRAEVGDGTLPDGKTFQDMTALANSKLSLTIQDAVVSEEDSEQMDVTTIVTNTGVEEGFFIREIGLFAKGADGIEKLYAYTNAGDYPDYLPSYKLNEITDQLTISVIISNEKNVTVNINDNFTIATKKNLKDHDENADAHVNLIEKHNADMAAHDVRFDAHDKNTSAHAIRFNEYLPRAGGQMKNGATIGMESDVSALKVTGATKTDSGATVLLYGKDYAENAKQGTANIIAANGSATSTATLSPAGSFKIDNNEVITAKGGVMTTDRALVRDVNNSNLFVCGGKGEVSGAYVQVFGAEHSTDGGNFKLGATKQTKEAQLVGTPDGSLKWNGNEIITAGGGTINAPFHVENVLNTKDDSQLYVSGGKDIFTGAHGIFYGKNHSAVAGHFDVVAQKGDAGIHLIGTPDGLLSWNGRNVVRSINGEYANAAGDISIKTGDGNPIGTIIMYAANTMPEGYLLCDGSAISRTDYAELFKVIGTTWGNGDGSTTFNLPNAVGRFPEGSATAGGYIEAGLPNLIGTIVSRRSSYGSGSKIIATDGKLFTTKALSNGTTWNESSTYKPQVGIVFNAGNYDAIYGKSTTVQPLAIQYMQLIKYI